MKNSQKYRSIIAVSLMLFILSCDKINNPIESNIDSGDCELPVFNSNPNTKRNVLVEDYTGHQCGNCPEAAVEIDNLTQTYGSQIISVAIHSGSFAETETNTGKYGTDQTTPHGDELVSDFGVSYFPSGAVSRINSGSGIISPYSQWETKVQSIINDSPIASIQIKTEYNTTNNQACIFVESEALQTLTNDYNLTIIVVEDNIVDWQKNYGGNPNYPTGDVSNYVHNHVLRDHVTGTYGELVLENGFLVGDKNTASYSYILNSGWNYQEISLIAYLYNVSTKEIIQVAKHHLE
jgi:hypothetical protein